jgi:NADP-dependent 3-hydroxy acid dehydrogenase YdfG
LVLVGRNEDKLKALAPYGDVFACDMRDTAKFQSLVTQTVSVHGGLHALINNAGMGHFNPVKDAPLHEWHDMVDINIKGALTAIHTCLPHLLAVRGHLINIASVGAHHVFPNSGIYCATKHALLAVSESLRLELSSQLDVTTISPGPVATSFIEKTTNPGLLQEYRDYFAQGLDPMTVAENIAFALSMGGKGVVSEIIVRPKRIER